MLHSQEPVLRFPEPVSSSLAVSVPAEIAAACYSDVDALAQSLLRDGDDGRTLDQLRADVPADLLLGRGPGTAAPEAAAMLSVHVPVDAALSISDEGASWTVAGLSRHRPPARS
ncbi:hypothetical protein [Prauserella alba]|uniref:hypothetical protein n=1 Tax=Prauserella alba TaxID=176898 RepID=UPI0020A55B29|nr:hypothetical protein [Prauserella alba]